MPSLLIAQIPSRKPYEHIFKGCRVSAELAQVQPLGSKRGKDARHRGVQLANRKLVHTGIDAVRLDSLQSPSARRDRPHHRSRCCQ